MIRQLKNQLKDAEIHYLTKQKHTSLLKASPYIDKLFWFDKKLDEILPVLKDEGYDFVIDLHNNIRSLKVKRALGAKSFSFKKLNVEKWLLVNLKINKLPNIHIVERYLDTIKKLGVKDDQQGLDYFIPEEDRFDIRQLPEPFQKKYIAVILAGTYFTKRLPAEKYFKLVKNAGYNFVLLGGENEVPLANAIMEQVDGNVIDYCNQLNINQSASVVKQAKLVISNDTGLMHIAAAFNKKILSIWGNTVPQLGMHPYLSAEGSKILEVANLKCRPCSKLGKHDCPKKHFRCMYDISEIAMLNWVEGNY